MPSLCFAFRVLFPLFILFSSSSHSFRDDRRPLLAFRKLVANDPNHSMANWISANPLCNWTGITCSRRHRQHNRVVALNLTFMDLGGSISPFLGNLSFLRILDLSDNVLHGHIPTQLGHLFRLRELWLARNELEGNIPNQLSTCRHLVSLALSFNNLTGNIPRELGFLTHLQELYLGSNSLTGTIPSSLGNLSALTLLSIETNNLIGVIPQQLGLLTNLQILLLHQNNLIGVIPPELGLLTSLQMLYLGENELSGSIPISLSNISYLTDLLIFTNKLNGSIPQELGLLTNLQVLYLYDNDLSGSLPSSLSNISTLADLEISRNKLTGIIPPELGLLNSLQKLYLDENELTGTIPSSLSNIANLNELYLWGNQLSGNIPNSIGNCSKLRELCLNSNKLIGSVPVELGKLSLLEQLYLHSNQLDTGSTTTMPFLIALTNCSHLKQLELSHNKFRGVLPLSIGRLSTNLSYLSLASNKIEGNIPPHISNLSSLSFLDLNGNLLNGSIPPLRHLENLERLYLSNNRLEGIIPNDFEQLQHLGLLDISENLLSGMIPKSLAHLKQLRRLFLHHNRLSGSIPASLGTCIYLELLDLSHNTFTGSIPREVAGLPNLQFYLNMSWNLLEGYLPMEIGKIAMAQAIDISANQLTGVIPTTLGSCSELQSLNLSQNAFQGSIPDSLGNLQSLMKLDLSSNSLSGTIPITLKKLKMIQYLNLSFNNLTGEIPKEGFLANPTIVMSLIGNNGLCGPQVFNLPACPTTRGHFSFVKKLLFPLIGVIAFVLCCLLLGFIWKGNMHMQNFDLSQAIFQRLEYQKISYQELHMATNGFTQDNLLGKGSFGLVYKGILSNGTLVAVKVLQLQNDQAAKSFKAECSVLQKVRHRNLVRIITSCCNLHFKGLVFQFMSNGSLEHHLYPNRHDNNDEDEDVCELGLQQRLGIAINVAHAIEYLHHNSSVQVVHCDIKPSNVLLDEDMLAHVTDFGIARLFGENSINSVTSTLALKGSVGYIAPEYGLGETVSTKGDVYSYGILLLEMLTRKHPTHDMFVGDLNLHKWVNLAFPNRVKEVIDKCLLGEVDRDDFEEKNAYKCLLSLLHVGLLCSKESPQERPTMRDVVVILESLHDDLAENTVAFRRLRRSISSMLGDTNATMNGAPALDDQSSSTFSL